MISVLGKRNRIEALCRRRGRWRGRPGRCRLLALVGIAGDVRSSDVHHIQKVNIDVRLVVPRVDDHRAEFRNGSLQRGLVHNLATGSVDEDRARLHPLEELDRSAMALVVSFRGTSWSRCPSWQAGSPADRNPRCPPPSSLELPFFRTLKPSEPATESTLLPTLPTPTTSIFALPPA